METLLPFVFLYKYKTKKDMKQIGCISNCRKAK